MTEKHLQGLAHGLQLAEVLPGCPVPPGRQGNGAAIGEHGEEHRGVVP
jgi:hypothetical protein